MTTVPEPHFGIIQQIFADIANDLRRDPLEHMLILTYEFDDQQLVNLLAGRNLADNVELQRNQLKFIADMQPVVIYDARKTREFSSLPHFLDLLPVNAGAWRCHHSKAYLFVTQATVRLVLGSFNLTRTGLFENREVFTDFLWSENDTQDLGVLREFSRLLRDGYAKWPQPGAASARDAIADALDERLERWRPAAGPDRHTLISSGYDLAGRQDGLSQLAALWKTVSDSPPRKLLAVSPFFDRGSTFLADALAQAIGAPDELHIVTDELNITALGRRHYGAPTSKQVRRLSLIPGGISDGEKLRISRANDGARLDSLEIRRALHAKILVLCGDHQHLVYCGSANFTTKAWDGANQELGVASIADGPGDTCIATVLASLAADSTDAYPRLADEVSNSDSIDDEDYVDQPGYPDFVSGIRLAQVAESDCLAFHFLTDQPKELQNYAISWGPVELSIEGADSRPIPRHLAYMRLQGGRNLRFTLRTDSSRFFLLPFFHDAALTQQQDLMIFTSAEDWMRHYLSPVSFGGGGEAEFVPGEDTGRVPAPDISIDRDANVVVAMQRYLNLFSAVEKSFHERARDLAAQPLVSSSSRARVLEQAFQSPLRLYRRLLMQEYELKGKGHHRHNHNAAFEAYQFKLGELVLLCISLATVLPDLIPLAWELAEGLEPSPEDAALATYVQFIREQLPHV